MITDVYGILIGLFGYISAGLVIESSTRIRKYKDFNSMSLYYGLIGIKYIGLFITIYFIIGLIIKIIR